MVAGLLANIISMSRPSARRRLLPAGRIASARLVNNGKQVDIEFADRTAYRFHIEWMMDSSPTLVGSDCYRKSARTVFDMTKYVATDVRPADDGSKLVVHYQNGFEAKVADEYVSSWLHAFAPHVGRPLHEAGSAAQSADTLRGTGSLLQQLHRSRRPWGADLKMPTFDANALLADDAMQVEFLERIIDPGVALITGLEPPQSLGNEAVGLPLERFVGGILGRLNQHAVRTTRYAILHTGAVSANADYDHANPLSMHTDHSVYHGTPGYLQFMYQARGSVRSKVCDGLAVTEKFRAMHPKEFHLLATVQLTHSSRNETYDKNGSYRSDLMAAGIETDPAPFELVHTHPIIELDAEGLLEKVVQSETKRGVCALPFDVYGDFMAAYRLWMNFVEQERFVHHFDWPEHTAVALNNWRLLHGRSQVPPGMERIMCVGYVMKAIFENRYRLLRQRQAEKKDPLMSSKWLTRLPNQVLSKLVQ